MHESSENNRLGLCRLAFFIPLLALSVAWVEAADIDWTAVERADSLLFARSIASQEFDSLKIALAEHIPLARQAGNTEFLAQALTAQGVAWLYAGEARRAEAVLAEGIELSLARADSSRALMALQQLTFAAGALGDLDEQLRRADRLLQLAHSARSLQYRAIAENFLGWNALQRGQQRTAVGHLEQAVQAHRELENLSDEGVALTSYGGVLFELGEFAAARAAYERQLELALQLENLWMQGQACLGLGDVESQIGDPAGAVRYYASARTIQRLRSSPIDEALALLRMAELERLQGRPQLSETIATEALSICEQYGFSRVRVSCLNALASAYEAADRPAAARERWQEVLALPDDADGDSRAAAALGLARLHQARGDIAAALATVKRAHEDLAERSSAATRLELLRALASQQLTARDFAAAERTARLLLESAQQLGLLDETRVAWQLLATCQWRRGEWAQAETSFERACQVWEQLRLRTGDPSWREWWGASGIDLGTQYAAFLLEHREIADPATRVRRAFDVAERFKTRTLRERIAGPSSFTAAQPTSDALAPPPLAQVQSELRAGERLYEWFCGRDRTLLFVVSQSTCAAYSIVAQDSLAELVQVARDLIATPDVQLDGVIARGLMQRIFAGATADLDRDSTLVLATDGPLHRLPFAALFAAAGVPRPHWRTPSAAVLWNSRQERTTPAAGVLVQLGPTARGVALPAAAQEAKWIARHLHAVQESQAMATPELEAQMVEHGILHFTGHTEFDDQFPWRSGIQLAPRTAASDSAAAVLRAASIAELRLRAELVVLSSCSSAEGRIQTGEGVAGLSGAFLAAGVPAVVASLWPVEDAATAQLMQELYRSLGQGRSIGESLEVAQASIRGTARTSSPYYWAGFVVIGDGTVHPRIRARSVLAPSGRLWLLLLTAGAALATGFFGWRSQRSFSRV